MDDAYIFEERKKKRIWTQFNQWIRNLRVSQPKKMVGSIHIDRAKNGIYEYLS